MSAAQLLPLRDDELPGALEEVHSVLRNSDNAQVGLLEAQPASADKRQRLALALLVAASAPTPGLTMLALRLVLIEGTSRRWFGDAIRAAASYLLAIHADAEIASFLAGDRGSLLAADILIMYCPTEMIAPIVPVLVAKLGRDVSPAVCRPIILRLLPNHADQIAEALAGRPERLESRCWNELPRWARNDVEAGPCLRGKFPCVYLNALFAKGQDSGVGKISSG